MTDQMCQKWFAKFRAGDFCLDSAPWSGGPVEVDSGQIETLTENNQRYIMREIADTQNIEINKVIGENENCAFYFTEKNKLLGQPSISAHRDLFEAPRGVVTGICPQRPD